MKTTISPFPVLSLAAAAGCFLLSASFSHAQDTLLSYQGRVLDNGTNFNGTGRFKFALIISNQSATNTFWCNDGTSVGGSEPSSAVSLPVNNGLFMVALGDTTLANMVAMNPSIFAQPNLQLSIWFSDGVNPFGQLNPPQNLTPAPYAVVAQSAAVVPGLTVQPNTGTGTGAPNIVGGSPVNYVNAGVIGATIGGGGATNYQAYGGLTNNVTDDFGTIGGGAANVAGPLGTVGGGWFNWAGGPGAQYATVAGGCLNFALAEGDSIGGGEQNFATNSGSTVAGGFENTADGWCSTVSGGFHTSADGMCSFAAGNGAVAQHDGSFVWADSSDGLGSPTFSSTASNQFSVRATGGVRMVTGGAGLTVDGQSVLTSAGGYGIIIQPDTSGYGAPNIIAGSAANYVNGSVIGATISGGGNTNWPNAANSVTGNYGTVSGGVGNTAGSESTVGGGKGNSAVGMAATVSGGYQNTATNSDSTVAGGTGNTATGNFATVGGGSYNFATNDYATVPGGAGNVAAGMFSFAAGYAAQALHDGSFVWADDSSDSSPFPSTTNNEFSVRAYGGVRFLTGGAGLTVDGQSPLMTAGSNGLIIQENVCGAPNITLGSPVNYVFSGIVGGTISGGGATNWNGGGAFTNAVWNDFGTIAGGAANTVWGEYATVSGGCSNFAGGAGAFVGGGGYDGSFYFSNAASGPASVVCGGTQNTASGNRGAVGGGAGNSATNWYATVPGGVGNVAGGNGSFAAGQAAQAIHDGSFVWNCDQTTTSSTAVNQFMARATGGFMFYTGGTSNGVKLVAGGGSWTSLSDRNAKSDLEPVNARSVLDKVAALPVTTWRYKSQDAAIRHIGPMAQDFKAAFGVGETDTGITAVDAEGVALAAIQGLNQKLEETRAENAELREQLKQLKALVLQYTANQKGTQP